MAAVWRPSRSPVIHYLTCFNDEVAGSSITTVYGSNCSFPTTVSSVWKCNLQPLPPKRNFVLLLHMRWKQIIFIKLKILKDRIGQRLPNGDNNKLSFFMNNFRLFFIDKIWLSSKYFYQDLTQNSDLITFLIYLSKKLVAVYSSHDRDMPPQKQLKLLCARNTPSKDSQSMSDTPFSVHLLWLWCNQAVNSRAIAPRNLFSKPCVVVTQNNKLQTSPSPENQLVAALDVTRVVLGNFF